MTKVKRPNTLTGWNWKKTTKAERSGTVSAEREQAMNEKQKQIYRLGQLYGYICQ